MQIELTRVKVGKSGGGTYVHAGTRAKVVVSRKLFADGQAPETMILDVENVAADNPRYVGRPVIQDSDKLAKAQERVARAQERAAKAAEKAKKAAEKAEQMAAKIAEM